MNDQGNHNQNPKTAPSVHDEDVLENPESDDDVDEMVEEIIGRQPKQGETFNDMINGTKPEEAPEKEDEESPNKP